MQKLGGLNRGDSGSTLVGAVVICAVIGIGIAGLLGILRNTVGQEAGSQNDAEAFLAAESGLLMAADWVMAANKSVGGVRYLKLDGEYPVDMSGSASVKIGAERPTDGDKPGFAFTENHIKLYSVAGHPGLPYAKRLEWVVEVCSTGVGRWKLKKIGWRETDIVKK
jgi:hypothetical protein